MNLKQYRRIDGKWQFLGQRLSEVHPLGLHQVLYSQKTSIRSPHPLKACRSCTSENQCSHELVSIY